jgi:hypothetical protein
LIKVDVCWRQAESHLSDLAGLVLANHIRREDIPSVTALVQTFYYKLRAVDAEIERLRKPFLRLKKLRYVFGYKGLGELIRDLEQWCNRLNHDHVKKYITYDAEREVRALASQTRDLVRGYLHRSQAPMITAGHEITPRFLPASEERQLLASEERQLLESEERQLLASEERQLLEAPPVLPPSLPNGWQDYKFDINAGRSRWSSTRILGRLFRIFKRSNAT